MIGPAPFHGDMDEYLDGLIASSHQPAATNKESRDARNTAIIRRAMAVNADHYDASGTWLPPVIFGLESSVLDRIMCGDVPAHWLVPPLQPRVVATREPRFWVYLGDSLNTETSLIMSSHLLVHSEDLMPTTELIAMVTDAEHYSAIRVAQLLEAVCYSVIMPHHAFMVGVGDRARAKMILAKLGVALTRMVNEDMHDVMTELAHDGDDQTPSSAELLHAYSSCHRCVLHWAKEHGAHWVLDHTSSQTQVAWPLPNFTLIEGAISPSRSPFDIPMTSPLSA